MHAGFAKQPITPRIGLAMAGYVGLRKSTGVLDELHVRCIYMKQKEEIFLFQYDLLYVDATFTNKLIQLLCDNYTIKKENIIITAMHTHSGPAQLLDKSGIHKRLDYIDGGYDEELVNQLVQQGYIAAKNAYEACEEARITFSFDHVRDIATNRNQRDKAIDDMLSVLEIKTITHRRALIFSYACHPTIFHEENSCYSCDLLGATFEGLEKDYDVAMFYNGACGDVSTRFTKKGCGIEEAKRLGLLLATHVLEIVKQGKPIHEDLTITSFIYTCPTRTYPPSNDIQAYIAQCDRQTKEYELSMLYEKMAKSLRDKSLALPIRILTMGTISYIYVPVELFSTLALYIKKQLHNKTIVIVSYAMDYYSYMPDRSAYHEHPIGFEAVISPFEEGCGEALMDAIVYYIHNRKKSCSC